MDSLTTRMQAYAPALCQRFGIKRLGIFGSVARNQAKPESDLDLFAEFENPEPTSMPDRYFGFIQECEQAVGRPIHLVTDKMVRNPHFRRSLTRDLIMIYG